ncbi:MAG: hypothetical protein AAFN30_00010 [Actinomycetota bacterium]
MAEEQRRVDLVVQRQSVTRSPFIGFGLLASLVIGAGPLSNAALGVGSFESAIGRFLLIVVACAMAGAVLGRLLDGSSSRTLDPKLKRPMEGADGTAPTQTDGADDAAEEETP